MAFATRPGQPTAGLDPRPASASGRVARTLPGLPESVRVARELARAAARDIPARLRPPRCASPSWSPTLCGTQGRGLPAAP